MQKAVVIGFVGIVVRIGGSLHHGHHHIDVGSIDIERPLHIGCGAEWRCGLKQHHSIVVDALFGIELHSVEQHLVGSAFVGGEIVGAQERHFEPHGLHHIGNLLRVGAHADVGIVGKCARHLHRVGYERFAAKRLDILSGNAFTATAGRNHV